jgi:hypothetical protein
MSDGWSAVRSLLPGDRIERLQALGGSNRSRVTRIRATSSTQTRSLIVKEFLAPDEGWVRESAALATLPEGAPAPRLVADGSTPPIVVMSDLGAGPNVADALLGDDPAAATTAMLSWAQAVATVHRLTYGSGAAFTDELSIRSGATPVQGSKMASLIERVAVVLPRHCLALGIEVPTSALTELRDICTSLPDDGPSATLTPADACPDNNIRSGDELLLIDFESAQWRHAAWDVAYLSVPWPTCWCSWRLPADVTKSALERYRAVVGAGLPWASQPEFTRDVELATTGWAFISTSRLLPSAVDGDPGETDPAYPTPARRAMILHRLDGARRVGPPGLAEFADRLHAGLTRHWGVVPLPYAPAFRE